MKTTQLLVIVALWSSFGCQKAAPTPVPATDTTATDNGLAVSDTNPADALDDSDAEVPDQTDTAAPADDADSTGVTDVAAELLDSADDTQGQDAPDSNAGDVDTSQEVDAIYIADAGSPTCVDKYGPMPMPGQPCSKLGEVRCSDYQAQEGALPFGSNTAACLRYNRVVCSQGPSSGPIWLLLPCPEVDTTVCKTPSVKSICIDYPEGGVCAPWLPGGVAACVSGDVGKLDCLNTGSESLYSCRKPSEPAADYVTNQIIKSQYAWLKTCCPDCRFWLPWQLCPKVNICDCKEVPPQECPGGAGDSHVCIQSLDGGAPGCATNCTNVKQWSGWDQGFK
jgi:hypothetical protein